MCLSNHYSFIHSIISFVCSFISHETSLLIVSFKNHFILQGKDGYVSDEFLNVVLDIRLINPTTRPTCTGRFYKRYFNRRVTGER